jgi:hypothetical protein
VRRFRDGHDLGVLSKGSGMQGMMGQTGANGKPPAAGGGDNDP